MAPDPVVPVPVYRRTPQDLLGKSGNGAFITVKPVPIEPGEDLYIGGTSVVGHTYTLVPWTGGAANASGSANASRFVPPGGDTIVRGSQYKSVVIDAADSNVKYETGPEGNFDGIALPPGIAGSLNLPLPQATSGAGDVTLVGSAENDDQSIPPTSIAGGTAEAVSQAGANGIPATSLVEYAGSAAPGTIVTAGDILNYVALKGHTSGEYYVVVFAGTGLSGFIQIAAANSNEKLDIVTRVQDTVAKAYAFHWTAVTGS